MTQEETISNLKAYLDGNTAVGNIIPLRNILESAIKYLSEPSLPSDLDEAADTFNREDAARMWDYEGKTEGEIVEAAFKAGAEWMAGQGYTFETIMQEDDVDELVPTCPDMYNHGYSCGDKVIVQIRKKL